MSTTLDLPGQQADDITRVPPHDIEAEQAVLGGMLLSKDAITDVLELLTGADFYRPAHQAIWQTITDMYAAGEPADPITVAAELKKTGALTRVGGPGYLHHLVQATPTSANAEYYAEIVQDRATCRHIAEAGARIAQLGYTAEGDGQDIATRARADLDAVTTKTASDDCLPFAEGLEATLDELETIQGRGGEMTGVPTGFTDLDSLTNGFQPGQMIVVAGRPAMGKSALSTDFARAAAIRHHLGTAVFSLEMNRSEINMRILSAEARVALHHMRNGTMTDDDWTRLARRMPALTDAPLYIDDSPNLSMLEIRAKCHRLKQRGGLKLVVIDYLQLMQTGSSKRPESRQQEVSEMSRNLKLLAKELEVPVVVLSQLNRGPEQREDKTPKVSDLRESGAVEQDADMVILLHREDAYEKESPRAGEADLIVGKHRNGPTATVTVAFQGHYSRFVDMAAS